MKLLIVTLFIVFTNISVFSQIIDFPDANFKNALLNHNPIIDTNSDGEIQITEAQSFNDELFVGNENIHNLSGIEYFTNITVLDCSNNLLTNLNLSNNIQLNYLNFYNNHIDSIDLSMLENLNELVCGMNNLTELTVPYSVIILNCQLNNLTSLDLYNHSQLIELWCGGNNLTTLNLTNCENILFINCENNNLIELNISFLTNLQSLTCDSNDINYLNISHNPYLTVLACNNNFLNNLDLSHNHYLHFLYCASNNLTELDLSNQSIYQLACDHNHLTSLDLSDEPMLRFLWCFNNDLTFLDIRNGMNQLYQWFRAENNPNLTCIYVDNAQWSTANWNYVDPNSTFVETEQQCEALTVQNYFAENINVFPNPFSDKIIINDYENKIIKLEVIDDLGQKLIVTENLNIDTNQLKEGIYFLNLYLNNGNFFSEKLIKN